MRIDWKRTEPPKDRNVLVYGQPEGEYGSSGQNSYMFTRDVYLARWDDVDEAFCLKGGGWLGPFIEPIAWAEEPEAPNFG